MKNHSWLIFTVLTFGFFIFSPNVFSQNVDSNKDEAEVFSINPAMSYEIVSDKTAFFQLEPVGIKCKFVNLTGLSQTTIVPDFLKDSWIEVTSKEVIRQFNQLSMFSKVPPAKPVTFEPGTGFKNEIVLETNLSEFFPEPGTYSIQLILFSSGGKKIPSNSIELKVLEPEGLSKEAYEFIQKNKDQSRYPVLFTWNDQKKNEAGETLLEEFVKKYHESIYGDAAIYQLGNYYYRRGQFKEAKEQFQRLKFTGNHRIAKAAAETLSDVEKSESAERINP